MGISALQGLACFAFMAKLFIKGLFGVCPWKAPECVLRAWGFIWGYTLPFLRRPWLFWAWLRLGKIKAVGLVSALVGRSGRDPPDFWQNPLRLPLRLASFSLGRPKKLLRSGAWLCAFTLLSQKEGSGRFAGILENGRASSGLQFFNFSLRSLCVR